MAAPDKPNELTGDALQKLLAQATKDKSKEVAKSVDAYLAGLDLKHVTKDVLGLVTDKLKKVADFNEHGVLIVPSKNNPERTMTEYISAKLPTLLTPPKQETGDVQLKAFHAAAGSLALRADLLKSGMSMETLRAGLQLLGGDIDKIFVPIEPKHEKPGTVSRSPNPFAAENWNVTAQAKLVQALGLDKANAIQG